MNDEEPRKRKVILLGFDGLPPELLDRYRGRIPELEELLSSSFFSPAHSSPYTCTATNWNTIATGSWVGTHGVTSFWAHLKGMDLGETIPTFNSTLCQSEYFYHAAERQGKRCILINYPTAFPLKLEKGIVVGGDGLSSTDWTVRSHDFVTSFRGGPGAKPLVLGPAGEWGNVPASYEVLGEGIFDLEGQMKFSWGPAGVIFEGEVPSEGSERRFVLIVKDAGQTKIVLSRSRDAGNAIAILAEGDWSGWVEEEFLGRRALRQYKALDLSEDGRRVTVFGTMAGCLEGWGWPEGIEESIIEHAGAYVEALELSVDMPYLWGWFGTEVSFEIMRMQADFLTDCADFLSHGEDWDVMFVQNHIPDGINHMVLADLESPDPARREEAETFVSGTIRIISDMIQAIKRRCADDNTVICVVSDHGNVPCPKYVNTNSIMLREGWSLFNQNEETGDWSLDAERSSAVFEQWQSGFWINVRGREKHGFVERGEEEYERLRTEIIRRFRNVRDPETGEDVFALVGRREDFQSLGMWGERLPDVIGFVKPGYLFLLGEHNGVPEKMMALYLQDDDVVPVERAHEAGIVWPIRAVHWHLPYATAGFTSNRAICLINGPGVVEGKRGERVNLVDVSATLAHVLDINPPAQCEGRVIREAFSEG